jgi:hypothetical protein
MNARFATLVLSLALTSMASAATSFDVALPTNSTTGVAFSFTVTARTGSTTDTAYTGTVHFTSSDPGAALPADYTFTLADAGSHTFSATMQTSGPDFSTRNQSITATDTGNASITGTGVTTVKWAPDVVRRIVVDVPETVDRTVPFQGTVSAWNSDFQVVPGYRGTVHFRSTDGIVLPPDYTFTAADNGTHTFTFTANRGGNHAITAEDVSEPQTGSSDSFSVNCPELTATASNAGPVCPNGMDHTILLGNSNQTGVTYYWSGPHTWFSFEQNPSAPGPGTYFLEVSNAEGCRSYAQTTVEAKAMQNPNVSVSSTRACEGDTITVSVVDAANYSDFEWSLDGPGTIVSGQGTSSIQIAVGPPGGAFNVAIRLVATYTPSGCRVSNLSYVDVDDRPVAAISTATSACPNATLTASVLPQPFTTYEWSVTNGTITKSMGPTIEYVANASGEVVVHARLVPDSGCDSSDTAVVALDGPTANIIATNLPACAGHAIEIPVDLSGTPPFTIVWSDGISQSGINARTTSRSVEPAETTSYAIASVSDAVCSGTPSGSVTIDVEAAPVILAEPRDVAIARGQTATLTVTATGRNAMYIWYRGTSGDRSHPVAFSFSRSYTTPALTETTQYWVEVEAGCGTTQSRTAEVDVATKRRAARH